MIYRHIPSPVGPLLLAASQEHLCVVEFERNRYPAQRSADWSEGDSALLREAHTQLDAYFAGRLRRFSLPLQPAGTAFQRAVWAMLAEIPYGATWSYGELAQRVGRPAAVRAVGAANGRNPLPILLPCHRVIGKDGSLTGFGGGLPTKQFLLRLESAAPPEPVQLGFAVQQRHDGQTVFG